MTPILLHMMQSPQKTWGMQLVRLSDLGKLDIRRPETIQRSIDDDRVADIVRYQRDRIVAGLSPIFPGAIVVANSADDDGVLWLVDGQHRWEACRGLRDMAPDCVVAIQEFKLGPGSSLSELFRLVNASVPVPEYMVDATLSQAHVALLARFEQLFKAKYAPFLSRSAQPRRPNVNLDQIKNVIHRNRHTLLESLPGADAVMRYVEWVNAQLLARYVTPELRDKAVAKHASAPLVLSHDVDNKWADDPRWLQAYRASSTSSSSSLSSSTSSSSLPPPLEHCSGQQRTSVTQAMRRAVWIREFGERNAVGHCHVCRGEILLMNFDVGHVRAVARGGATELSNLQPICRPCNLGMGTADMHEFREAHFGGSK